MKECVSRHGLPEIIPVTGVEEFVHLASMPCFTAVGLADSFSRAGFWFLFCFSPFFPCLCAQTKYFSLFSFFLKQTFWTHSDFTSCYLDSGYLIAWMLSWVTDIKNIYIYIYLHYIYVYMLPVIDLLVQKKLYRSLFHFLTCAFSKLLPVSFGISYSLITLQFPNSV